MPQSTKSLIKQLILSIAAAVIIGFGALIIAKRAFTHESLWYEIIRDVGIAFIVAAIVTIIYEFHARTRYDRENIEKILYAVTGEFVHKDIWTELKNQILEKDMIRENVDLTLKLEKVDGLPPGQTVLWMEFIYDLYGLKFTPKKVEVMHYLDAHIENNERNLPQFECVEIVGKKLYEGAELTKMIKDGTFIDRDVELEPRDAKKPVRIITRRREITYVPGSYNLIMGELTKGIRLHLEALPSDLEVEVVVNIRPHTPQNGIPLDRGKTLPLNYLLLPGQGCEFRFKPKKI